MKKISNQKILPYTILFLVIIVVYVKLIKIVRANKKENFANKELEQSEYNKMNEVKISNTSEKHIKNKNLAQCKEECDNDDKCIGFARDAINDEKQGNCYLVNSIGDCHSNKKGNANQRYTALNYNSYVKTSYKDNYILSKCFNNKLLNKSIHINSHLHPNKYLSIKDNNLYFLKYPNKGFDFKKNTTFKIVNGLSGSGTVSFIILDNFNENYYLCTNPEAKYLELKPIDLNNTKEKEYASFELLTGLANKNKVTIKKYNSSTNQIELFLILNNNKEPRISLTRLDDIDSREKREKATFNLISNETYKSILTSDNNKKTSENNSIQKTLNKHNNQKGINEGDSDLKSQFKNTSSKTKNNKTKERFESNFIVLVDKEGNRLNLPTHIKNYTKNKIIDFVKELNQNYADDANLEEEPREFDLSSINKIIIDNPNVSCRIYDYNFMNKNEFGSYKTLFEKTNIINNLDTNIKRLRDYDYNELSFLAKQLDINTSNKNKNRLYIEIVIALGTQLGDDKSKENLDKIKNRTGEEANKVDNIVTELVRNINSDNYFKINSIQIFYNNPKSEFNKKTYDYSKYDYVNNKTKNLEKLFLKDNSSRRQFNDYKNGKANELRKFKDLVFTEENNLLKKTRDLSKQLNNVYQDTENYKLSKIAKQHGLMKGVV